MASSTPAAPTSGAPSVRVVRKHHALVRLAHWAHVPLLAGLIASGLSIHWAAPVFPHAPAPGSHTRELLQDVGVTAAALLHDRGGEPRAWVYDHFSLGGYRLAAALQLHWLLAYLYMLAGATWLLGLALGGGWRALLPRPSDARDAAAMLRFYAGALPATLARRPWPHPDVRSKYNALQRGAYATMALCGALVVASGWAMHKPATLGWLERAFGGYDGARVVHFACMSVIGAFLVPHVLLVVADGWDTFRAMVTGWSARTREAHDEPR